MRPLATSVALTLLTAAAAAQSLTVPNGLAAAEGNSSNAFPWNRFTATPLRTQLIYDSVNFPGVTQPIVISRLRWRANATAGSWTGGTMSNCQVEMSTAAVDVTAPSTDFNANHGPDRTVVFSGNVTFIAGTGNGTGVPGPTVVDLTLAAPFVYNPSAGDLLIDCQVPGGSTGGGTQLDVSTTNPNACRVYDSTNAGVGTIGLDHGVVVTIDYVPAVGLFPAFSATPTTGGSPLTVQFNDLSFSSDPGGVLSWQWDLNGDSVVDSTLQNPTFTYTACGNYTVSLTVIDATHGPVTVTRPNFIKTDVVTADFTHSFVGVNTVQFTDTTTPAATSWAWDFDNDSVVDSTLQNPVHVYPANTPLTPVTLTASRLCGPTASVTHDVVPTGGIATTFAGGNGLSASGAGNVFDLQVSNPLGINVTSVDVVPWSTAGGPVTCDIYLTDDTSGYASNHANQALWRLVATGSGTAQASTSTAPVPINMTLNQRFYVAQGSYSMAIHMNGSGIVYTTGNGTNQVYSNADVTITCGLGKGSPFATSANNPRVWNGILHYDLCNVGGLAGYGFFGAGCAGSTGVTHLQATTLPILGQTMTVIADNLPQNVGLMVLGFSRTTSVFGPLPLDLAVIGAPGCLGRVSNDFVTLLIGASNQASYNVPIPNNAALMCLQFYNQMLVVDPTANGLGGVVSDAAAGIIGN